MLEVTYQEFVSMPQTDEMHVDEQYADVFLLTQDTVVCVRLPSSLGLRHIVQACRHVQHFIC